MKILIIGGVAGGAGTAARLRRNDEKAEIIILEKGGFISFANCGLPYYIGGIITDRNSLLLQTPESFRQRFNIEVRVHHEAMSVNAKHKTVTIKNQETGNLYTETYDKLVLSPGATPILPRIPGAEDLPIFTLRGMEDADRITTFLADNHPKTAVIIGGGAIGMEMAENLLRNGITVSVVDAAEHIIGALDSDMAAEVSAHAKAKGVHLYLRSMVERVDSRGRVVLTDGKCLEADMILVSIGVRPETGFLAGSGIALGVRGEILVNDTLQTNQEDIWALGDAISVCRFSDGQPAVIPLASPANKQARIVADIICGKMQQYRGTQGTSIVKIFDMTVAMTGENERTLTLANTPYLKSITYSPSNATYYPAHDFLTIKLLFAPVSGRILGAQAVGLIGVDKRMDTLSAAVRAGLTVRELGSLEFCYAPPFSSAKDPVNMAGYVAENILCGMSNPFYAENVGAVPAEAILLDVRTREEFVEGTLQGAKNIPVDELRSRLGELDTNKEIYVFCQIGQRGYIAERILRQNGYNVRNLSGGYLFWEKQKDTD